MIKIKSFDLKKAVSKLSKVQVNKIFPITEYWRVEASNNKLTITGTDSNNFMKVTLDVTMPKKKSIDLIVKASQFGKLIDKTSVSEIELVPNDSYLLLKGNGEYKIAILEDEEYPMYEEFKNGELGAKEVHKSEIDKLIAINKNSVSTNINDGALTGYYVGEGQGITTDSIKICISPVALLDRPVLLSQEMLTLLGTVDDKTMIALLEEVEEGVKLLFKSSDTEIFGMQLDGEDKYPYEAIMEYANEEFLNEISINSNWIKEALDRLTLFISPFEKNEVRLTFKPDILEMTTSSGSIEHIRYNTADSEIEEEWSCIVNCNYFRELLTALTSHIVTFGLGNEKVIKLSCNSTIEFLATGEE